MRSIIQLWALLKFLTNLSTSALRGLIVQHTHPIDTEMAGSRLSVGA